MNSKDLIPGQKYLVMNGSGFKVKVTLKEIEKMPKTRWRTAKTVYICNLHRGAKKLLRLNSHTKFLKELKDQLSPYKNINTDNVFHFVYIKISNQYKFELVNYLAIKSCIEVNKPDKVFLYMTEDFDSKLWEKIKRNYLVQKKEYLAVALNMKSFVALQKFKIRMKMLLR